MELQQYYHTVRRWLWLILFCTFLGAGAAFAISTGTTPVYQASATLLVQQAPSGDTTEYQALLGSERLARTYSEMLKARPIMENVIRELGLKESPAGLAQRTTVELVRDTQLIRLKVEHTDPTVAALAANAVAEAFVSYTETLQQRRYADSMANLERQMGDLSQLIDDTEGQIDALGFGGADEWARLESILAGYRNSYTAVVQDYEKMRVTAARGADDVVLFEAAVAPATPVRPQRARNTLLAAVVGAMIGVGAAFVIEYVDDTVKSPDDLKRSAGISTIGAIGRLEGGELVASREPLSPIAEAFRTLRTSIGYAGVDGPLRTLLVTSPGLIEGKSTVAANLAVVMAQADIRVAVVDADLRRPRQHEIFGISQEPGLTYALVDGHVHRVLKTTPAAAGLSVIPAGELPPNPAEMLGSRRMSDLVERLREVADVVLIDSPPLLSVTDAAVLARGVDGVLLVVEVGRTQGAEIREGVEALCQVGAHVVGTVLNQVPASRGYNTYHTYEYYSENGHLSLRRGTLAEIRKLFRA